MGKTRARNDIVKSSQVVLALVIYLGTLNTIFFERYTSEYVHALLIKCASYQQCALP